MFHQIAARHTHLRRSPGPRVPGFNTIKRAWALLPKNPRSNWAVPSDEGAWKVSMIMSRWTQSAVNWELDSGDLCHPYTGTLIFSSCNTYQSQHAYPISKHHKTTLQIIRNFFFFLSWMTVNVTPKPSRRLSQRDECSHTNLEIRLGKPHTIDISSIYKGFSNGFNGTKYTVACSALVCACVCMCGREREREST